MPRFQLVKFIDGEILEIPNTREYSRHHTGSTWALPYYPELKETLTNKPIDLIRFQVTDSIIELTETFLKNGLGASVKQWGAYESYIT